MIYYSGWYHNWVLPGRQQADFVIEGYLPCERQVKSPMECNMINSVEEGCSLCQWGKATHRKQSNFKEKVVPCIQPIEVHLWLSKADTTEVLTLWQASRLGSLTLFGHSLLALQSFSLLGGVRLPCYNDNSEINGEKSTWQTWHPGFCFTHFIFDKQVNWREN